MLRSLLQTISVYTQTINFYIPVHLREALKLNFLAEAEQNETLGRRVSHFFPHVGLVFFFFSPLHKLNSQKVLFTVLYCFLNKKKQLQNNYLKIFTEHLYFFLTFYQTLYQQSTIFDYFWEPFLNQACIFFCTNKYSFAEKRLILKH